jgi:hypothetical protein
MSRGPGDQKQPANVTIDERKLAHIFRDADGHLADTPANRQALERVPNDSTARLGVDKWGNVWNARTTDEGKQIWVQMRNGRIVNGGMNEAPRAFHSETGLSGQ